jgi:hypothetical protein
MSAAVTIRGNGNAVERATSLPCPDPAGRDFRLLEITSTGDVVVEDLTLRNGCAASGGGIFNAGALLLQRSAVRGNRAVTGDGGGILNENGFVELDRSRLEGNSASGRGGAVYNAGDALLRLSRSAVSENSAGVAGGLANLVGRIELWNSTVSGNSAEVAGAIENSGGGFVSLVSSTIAANRASVEASGIFNRNGSLRFGSSILRDRCVFLRSPGAPDAGHNLDARDTCGLVDPTSLRNTAPALGPLQDNGGPTPTHAVLAGSPVIDAGDDAACSAPGVAGVDQRGASRPDGDPASPGRCDIGAVEFVDCDANGVDDGVEIAGDPLLDADGDGVLDACQNQPPVADAGGDQSLECGGPEGAEATLDGSGSSDPDGDPLSFLWTGPFGVAAGAQPLVALPLGVSSVTLEVTDAAGSTAQDSLDLGVHDTTAPSVKAWLEASRGKGSKRHLRVHFQCSDVCDGSPTAIATWNGEPVVDGQEVRSRKSKRGAAEPALEVRCSDAAGNEATATATAPVVDAKKKAHRRLHDRLAELQRRLMKLLERLLRAWSLH